MLVQRRKELGLTIEQVAKMAGVSERAYRRYEKGEVKTDRLLTQQAIATALLSSVEALSGSEEQFIVNCKDLEKELFRLLAEAQNDTVIYQQRILSKKEKEVLAAGLRAVLRVMGDQTF